MGVCMQIIAQDVLNPPQNYGDIFYDKQLSNQAAIRCFIIKYLMTVTDLL